MTTGSLDRKVRGRPARRLVFTVFGLLLAVPTALMGQVIGPEREGSGLHVVLGGFGGQFDLQGGPRIDVLGGRAGLGLGELVQLTGFYWHEVDFSEQDFLDDRAWGGEVQLNLNAGFGVTPFLTTGLGRVRTDTLDEHTAAIVGAGLLVPLGPVALHVAARDYIFGVGGLGDAPDDRGTTHNWLFSAGVTATLGRDRAREPVVAAAPAPVARPAPAPEPRPAVRDTVVIAADEPEAAAVVRNFQSDQRIEIPLPLEGSITIRYGPEPPAQAQAPIVLGQAPQTVDPAAPQAQVAPPAQAPQAVQPVPTPFGVPGATDPAVDRILAALMPRLEAAEARRYDQLRADLNRALAAQQSMIRELVRAEVAGTVSPSPATPEPVPPERTPAADVPPDRLADAISAATARLAAARAEIARLEDGAVRQPPAVRPSPAARTDAEIRMALADLAARHGAVLSTTQTERGPAVVVADGAFDTGAWELTGMARSAVQAVAAMLAANGEAVVYVQGHTDSVGDETANQVLSERRAETVRSLLVQAGLDPRRVHALGFGEGRPIATNETAAGRALNRRVEIVVGAWSAGSNGGAP